MEKIVTLLLSLVATAASAQGVLENPASGSSQSGIGVISGWHCTGQRIEIQIDTLTPLVTGSGTDRLDTMPVCGRRNTGFSLLFNWNLVPSACDVCPHTIVAKADGVPFASNTFTLSRFGPEFMTGKSARYDLANFPSIGYVTALQWDEAQQNFAILFAGNIPNDINPGGTYVGATIIGPNQPDCFHPPNYPTRFGTFTVGYDGGQLSLAVRYADGGTCTLPAVPAALLAANNRDGMVNATFDAASTASCPEFPGGLRVQVDGHRISGLAGDGCQSARVTAAK